MSLNIKNKRSAVQGSAPTPAQLEDGEIGVNYNAADPALYVKDSAGAVIRLAGDGAVAERWEQSGNNLYPKVATSNVKIGGTLPGTPNIELKADGSAEFTGRVATDSYLKSDRTGASDPVLTGSLNSSENIRLVANGNAQFSGDVLIGGTLPSAPNITLNANGSAEFDGDVTVNANIRAASGGDTRTITLGPQPAGIEYNVNGNLILKGRPDAYNLTFENNSSERMRINSAGDVLIGGTLPSSPNISLNADGSYASPNYAISSNGSVTITKTTTTNAITIFRNTSQNITLLTDGSAEFAGDVVSGSNPALSSSNEGVVLRSRGTVTVNRPSGAVYQAYTTGNSTTTAVINADGSALFAGSVSIGGTAVANTIDEYEEGTSTVDLTVGGVAAGLTGTDAQSTYTRIGNIVTVQVNLSISSASVSGLTGNLSITGLPFASSNNTRSNYATAACSIINWATDYANGSKTILATNSANSTSLGLYAGSRSSMQLNETAFDFTNGACKIYVTFTYRIA